MDGGDLRRSEAPFVLPPSPRCNNVRALTRQSYILEFPASSQSRTDCSGYWRCWLHWLVGCFGAFHISPPCMFVCGADFSTGSHIVYTLCKTERYKVISIDNYHNSLPESLVRVQKLVQSELGHDGEATKIASFQADLTKPDQIRTVFENFPKGSIWGVIHVAVRFTARSPALARSELVTGVQGCRRICRDAPHILPNQCWRHTFALATHARVRCHQNRILLLSHSLRHTTPSPYPRNYTVES